jgi:hypothetical protein
VVGTTREAVITTDKETDVSWDIFIMNSGLWAVGWAVKKEDWANYKELL